VTWNEAQDYVVSLNQKKFGGFSNWRLPTVNELVSLFIGNAGPYRFCFEPVFDPTKERIWSSDRKSYIAAWYVDAKLGFVWWQDFTCFFYVRAVRTTTGLIVSD
jgi:serine/threonine-protein kinase